MLLALEPCIVVIYMHSSPVAALPTLQSLKPASASLCLEVARFMREALGFDLRNPPLCVCGVSGGVDSLALALICLCLRVPVVLAHVDHSLRPESAGEAEQVAAFAVWLDMPLHRVRLDVAERARNTGTGLEEAGRNARYAFFEEVRAASGAAWICTGHHANDLAEDVLMRLVRGAGWPALAGMQARDGARRLARPLLQVPKQRLTDFLQSVPLAWCEDKSNTDPAFLRNRLRHTVLPALEAENPSLLSGIQQLWTMARIDEDFFAESLARLTVTETEAGLLLAAHELRGLHKALRLRAYVRVLGGRMAVLPRTSTLLAMDEAFMARRHNTCFQFAGGLEARLSAQGILFATPQPKRG